MKLLRKYLNRSQSERQILIQVICVIAAIRAALLLLPFRYVQRLIASTSADCKMGLDNGAGQRRRILWAVRAIGKRMLGDKPCLTQALAVQWLFGRRGEKVDLHIGVTKGEQHQLLAHAWVVYQGDVIMGGAYAPTLYTPLRPLKQDDRRECA